MGSIYDAHHLGSTHSTKIRVIRVLQNGAPGYDALVSCELEVVSLDDAPSYKALSYVWGIELVLEPIILDGQPMMVRENLFNFLYQYRADQNEGYLWIDALCINQSNIEERNHQVGLMESIYSKAETVIAWLGRNSPLVAAITDLERFENLPDRQLADALYFVCGNDYWKRLWIVQEFVLCQKLQVWAGSAQMNGESFCEIMSLLLPDMKKRAEDPEINRKLDLCYWSNARTVATYRTENKRMENFLEDFISCECADRRDRIYGLLGVLNDRQKADFAISPDYSKPVAELYLDIWIMWLRSILYEPTSLNAATWFLEVKRYASRLRKRLQLNGYHDEKIAEIVTKNIDESKKKVLKDQDTWNEDARISHVKQLLKFAESQVETVERLRID